MATKQINLKLSKNLADAAESFAGAYGYRNVQDLAAECLREKIFERGEFDESFSGREIGFIDSLIEKSIKAGKVRDEKELAKALG
ncbi:MAG: hypothetical protein V1676_06215 [Candidatus Diapherotrites archaeon]